MHSGFKLGLEIRSSTRRIRAEELLLAAKEIPGSRVLPKHQEAGTSDLGGEGPCKRGHFVVTQRYEPMLARLESMLSCR